MIIPALKWWDTKITCLHNDFEGAPKSPLTVSLGRQYHRATLSTEAFSSKIQLKDGDNYEDDQTCTSNVNLSNVRKDICRRQAIHQIKRK